MRKTLNTGVAVMLYIFLFALIMTACQPTPDEPVIVNKNDGKLEAAMHESPAPLKPYEAPPHWTETVNDERLKITIDTDITMPDVDKYPVVKLEAAKFTQQRVDELVNYFAQGKKLYLPSVKTKTDYQDEIIEAKRGQLIDGEYVVDEGTLDWVEELERQQAEAPDESPKVYTDTTLTYYREYETGNEITGSGKNFLKVMVENGDGDDASITVGNFVAGYNLSASFSYSAHPNNSYISESIYRMNMEDITEEESGLAGLEELFGKVDITQEQAEAQAQKLISDLGIKDLTLVKAEKAVSPDTPDNGGYELRYMRQCGGIAAYMFNGGSWSESEKPPEYSPPFDEELLVALVTKEGVISIGWRGCADVVETVSENVELLPFEKIQQALKDQIFYKKSFQGSSHGMKDEKVTVKSAELRMGYIGVKDNVNQALMVPVWVFTTEYSQYNTSIGEEQTWEDNEYMLNAIDGGVVEMSRLDNILC